MRPRTPVLACGLALLVVGGCGRGSSRTGSSIETLPRKIVVWIDQEGADQMTVTELKKAGVDELVVPWGAVELGADVPLVRAEAPPSVGDGLPTAALLTLLPSGDRVDPDSADAVWQTLIRGFSTTSAPVEILAEIPHTAKDLPRLMARLAEVSGLPVVPVLAPSQLGNPIAIEAARQAGSCVVVALGQVNLWRKGSDAVLGPLRDAFVPLAAAGVKVRTGIVISPESDPKIDGWPDTINPLTEPETAEILPDSTLGRSFRMLHPVEWSGREWSAGQTISLAWTDAAELDAALGEASRLTMPVCAGWDLLWLPPEGDSSLGLGQSTLLAYLGGDGPEPRLSITTQRSGNVLRLTVENRSAFGSAVSRFGNWVEVDGGDRALVAEDRGDFDGIVVGTKTGGRFQRTSEGSVTAVHLLENFIAPGESLRSGRIRLGARNAKVTIRWHIQLSDGREVTGTLN